MLPSVGRVCWEERGWRLELPVLELEPRRIRDPCCPGWEEELPVSELPIPSNFPGDAPSAGAGPDVESAQNSPENSSVRALLTPAVSRA